MTHISRDPASPRSLSHTAEILEVALWRQRPLKSFIDNDTTHSPPISLQQLVRLPGLFSDITLYTSRLQKENLNGARTVSQTNFSQLRHHKSTTETANMGKVHGSLARAGKVKSQTPKVRISDISFDN